MKTYEPLTASRIKDASPRDRDIWLSDDHGFRGTGRLLLRITPSGLKRFYFRYMAGGARKTVPIGPYSRVRKQGCLTIEQARAAARELHLTGLRASRDGQANLGATERIEEDSRSARPATATTARLTVKKVCDAYVSSLESAGKVSAKEVRSVLNLYVGNSETAQVLARDATPEQFTGILRAIIKAGHGRTAGKVRSYLYSAYARALKARLNPTAMDDFIDPLLVTNPLSQIPSLSEFNKAGDRFLDRPELKELWRLLCRDDQTLGVAERMIRLDISLGGQRCKQLLRVKLKSVDVDNGTVLLLDGKGNRPQPREHRLPLTPFARADVEWLMDRARKLSSPHLFTNSTTKNAMQSEEVSKAVRQINKELLGSQRISSPFTYGDIRRTIETTLASMGVSKDIRAQIQSHGLGGIQARHYDRYDYMAEKRSALLMWSDFLQSLL